VVSVSALIRRNKLFRFLFYLRTPLYFKYWYLFFFCHRSSWTILFNKTCPIPTYLWPILFISSVVLILWYLYLIYRWNQITLPCLFYCPTYSVSLCVCFFCCENCRGFLSWISLGCLFRKTVESFSLRMSTTLHFGILSVMFCIPEYFYAKFRFCIFIATCFVYCSTASTALSDVRLD